MYNGCINCPLNIHFIDIMQQQIPKAPNPLSFSYSYLLFGLHIPHLFHIAPACSREVVWFCAKTHMIIVEKRMKKVSNWKRMKTIDCQKSHMHTMYVHDVTQNTMFDYYYIL